MKNTKENLAEKEDLLFNIIENLPNMIFVKEGEELKFELFNKAGEELLGVNTQDLIGKNDYDIFPKEQADFFVKNDREVLKNGKLLDIEQEKIQTPTGERILHTKKIPIEVRSGRKFLLGISEDITEIISEKKEKEKLERQLFLASKLASIGELATGVAHEINNPLNIVMGHMQLMKTELESENPNVEKLKYSLEAQNQGFERIAKIVKSLRTYSHMNEENHVLDVNESINNIKAFIGNSFYQKNINLIFEYSEDELFIKGNTGRFQQALMILISNAKDAVQLTHDSEIIIKSEKKGKKVLVHVIDNGCGIPEEIKCKIFEPFYTTKKLGEGSGIGLGLLSTIIQELNGIVEFDSKLGEGTRFTITLQSTSEKTS